MVVRYGSRAWRLLRQAVVQLVSNTRSSCPRLSGASIKGVGWLCLGRASLMNSALELCVWLGVVYSGLWASAWDFEKDKRVRRKVGLGSAGPCCCGVCSLALLPDVWGYTERDYHHAVLLGYCSPGLWWAVLNCSVLSSCLFGLCMLPRNEECS